MKKLYDSALGRFLSPDPYMQAPGNAQNYNRYSYCLNPVLNIDVNGEYGLPKHIIEGYPKFTNYIQNYVQSDVMGSFKMKYSMFHRSQGNLTELEVGKATTWGEGIIIDFGTEGAYNKGFYNEKTNTIELDKAS